jgi:hypothetical protein
VYVGGVRRFKSAEMTPSSATKSLSVDTTAANELQLLVADGDDGTTCDHADWAAARLTKP